MRVLLDTHVLLWWWFNDQRISVKAMQHIGDPDTVVFVSAASAWEIATKYRLGKLPEAREALTKYGELMRKSRMADLPIA